MNSDVNISSIDLNEAMANFQSTLAQTYPALDVEAQTLEDMQLALHQHDAFFRLAIAKEPTGTPAPIWFANDFTTAIDGFSDQMETKTAFAAPIWQKTLNACLFTSLLGLRLRFNCVPDLKFTDLHIETGDDHRVTRLSISTDTPIYTLEPMPTTENATLVSSHQELDTKLAAVIKRLGKAMQPHFKSKKVAAKLFWGNALYACGLAYSKLFNQPIDMQSTEANLFIQNQWFQSLSEQIQAGGRSLNEIKKAEFKGFQKWFVRRETCCLKYKIDGKAKCTTCNLIEPRTQIGLVEDALKHIVLQG
ncbi:(2Fe-2S)-binding protein [Vibrio hangzhouensis]|uniref:(2Fe-2S)-binding protein n=1 Tax=Vibrio hangzhouensis TaxID=462991 RepID=UPI001C9567DA|nr:(2Fe-2S)-binding protein [Vibrio hangzhouensis]MBY6197742.1 (2Fe-2S)-binding protein [Vibrio hangzhouensis]